MFIQFVLAVQCLVALVSASTYGVDLSVVTSVDDWNCLVQHNVSFGIVRVFRNIGVVDGNSANSIISASKAGIKSIDGYIFPCVQSSPYSISHNVTCPSAAEQVEATAQFLRSNGISVGAETEGHPYKVGRLWLDIEDEVPAKYYNSGRPKTFFAIWLLIKSYPISQCLRSIKSSLHP